MSLADLRREYALHGLDADGMDADPLVQFGRWFDEARAAGVAEPNAMVLATADADGRPSARVVLLKGLDHRGFAFFTNRESRKSADLAANPRAAVCFFWSELERQVRAEGRVAPLGDAESDAYWATRPRDSQLGAWASPQSRTLASRAELEARLAEVAARHRDGAVPRPPHWGGYVLLPEVVEFWQGRPARLHDRLVYRRVEGGWRLERLAP